MTIIILIVMALVCMLVSAFFEERKVTWKSFLCDLFYGFGCILFFCTFLLICERIINNDNKNVEEVKTEIIQDAK